MKLLNNPNLTVLVLGDIVGRIGRNAVIRNCRFLKEKYHADLLIVNGENATHGNGLIYKQYLDLVNAGVDCITMGNHIYGKKEILEYAKDANRLVVPANLENLEDELKNNVSFEQIVNNVRVKVINLLGIANINLAVKSPFIAFKEIYEADPEPIYIVDYHAELTAEKNSFGYELDGRASLMFGTHTHVQTADERIMPEGMAYISDVGMCGVRESVIGFDYQEVKKVMWEGGSYSVAMKGKGMLNGLVVTIDTTTKKATSIERINIDVE